jgi:predicted nucleic acid-binding protein
VASINRRDAYYNWVTHQLKSIQSPLLTCEAVITEACFLLRRRIQDVHTVLELLRRRFMIAPFHWDDETHAIEQLMVKYANVPMSFADAGLVRMAELYPNSAVLTLDSDFWIYRKHGNQMIPVIMPEIH